MTFGGFQLEDDGALYDYNIFDESVVRLVARGRGGGKKGGVQKGHLKENENPDRVLLLDARIRNVLRATLSLQLVPLQTELKRVFETEGHFKVEIETASKETVKDLKSYYEEGNKNGATFGRGISKFMVKDIQWISDIARSFEDAYELSYYKEFFNGHRFENARFKEMLDQREDVIKTQEVREEVRRQLTEAMAGVAAENPTLRDAVALTLSGSAASAALPPS